MKPRVYIETSVISYLTSRPSRDLIVAAHQQITSDWWTQRAGDFTLGTSVLVLDEASAGDAEAAKRRLALIGEIETVLPITTEAVALAQKLVSANALPVKAEADALHVAIATMWKSDYLLTWNCTHIANAETMLLIEATILAAGLVPPRITTPLELLKGKN